MVQVRADEQVVVGVAVHVARTRHSDASVVGVGLVGVLGVGASTPEAGEASTRPA